MKTDICEFLLAGHFPFGKTAHHKLMVLYRILTINNFFPDVVPLEKFPLHHAVTESESCCGEGVSC